MEGLIGAGLCDFRENYISELTSCKVFFHSNVHRGCRFGVIGAKETGGV
jgi:hypothetical protein